MTLRKADLILLAAAAAAGIAATMRSLGTEGISPAALALVLAAILLLIVPAARLFSAGGPSERNAAAILSVLFGCHLVGTLFFFPPEDLANGRPVLTLDHAVHYYQMERSREVTKHSFRLHTYDPMFMAGFPAGTLQDIDSKGGEAWCSILRFTDTARCFKAFIIGGYLLLVFTVYAGCRRLGYSFEESIFACMVLLAFWHWGRPYAGDFRYAGMFAYLFAVHLSLYVIGLFRSFLEGLPVRRFYLLGPLLFLIHPSAVVLLPASFLALFFVMRRRVPAGPEHRLWERRIFTRMALWCALVVIVNAVWLAPFHRYLDIKIPSQSFFQINGMAGLVKVLVKPGNLPALALIALAAAGAVVLFRRRRFAEALAPLAGSLYLFFLAGFGVYLPVVDQMEPGRFLVPAILFLAPLAGPGFALLLKVPGSLWRGRRHAAAARTAMAVALLACAPLFGMIESREYYRHTVSTTFTPEVARLIEALQERLGRPGRLMIEDGPAWAYGDVHLPSIIPLYTGVEQIGGPYAYVFIKHKFAAFTNDETMGMTLRETDPERMLEYIELYAVRWILTATKESTEWFDAFPYAKTVWSEGAFTLREISPYFTSGRMYMDLSEPGIFPRPALNELGGESDALAGERIAVRAAYDSITVAIRPGEGGEVPGRILLRYHWDRGLRVDPPARISPIMQLDDPVPFILLEPGGSTDIRIRFE